MISVYWELEAYSAPIESGVPHSRYVILSEVAMLKFDGSYGHHVFLAGSPFVRRGLAYPRASIEPPPQISSIRGNQVINNRTRIFAQSAFRVLNLDSGGFFVSGEEHSFNSIQIKDNI